MYSDKGELEIRGRGSEEKSPWPGRNITGFTSFNADIAGKWLQLLREISPATKRAGVIFNPDTAPHAIFLPVMRAVAPQIGIALTTEEVRDQG